MAYVLSTSKKPYHLSSYFCSQNHDNEANITHLAEIERELLVATNTYTRLAPLGVGGEEGPGNYWLPVRRVH